MSKHILVTMQWQTVNGDNLWVLDPGWVIEKQLAHNGQPTAEITPAPNGFTNELIVDDATAADMETNPICVLIWAQDV